ncbi:Bifunctional purine biosynthesis protein PurH [Coemansia sp. RSA 1285]|nr:Bifunctional purine biosynthesis protein PurH [Coemansia sp. RSA 1285]
MSHSFDVLPRQRRSDMAADATFALRPKYASMACAPLVGAGDCGGYSGMAGHQSLPRIFAVDLHEVDNSKFRDSCEAGFSWYVLFTTIIVSLSAATVGWSIGIANASKPIIFGLHSDPAAMAIGRDSGAVAGGGAEFPSRIAFSEGLWSVATGVLSVGGFLGALSSGAIANSIGRRNALVINNGLFLAGAVLMGTATTAVHFILGRFALGVGCGVASCAAPLYVGEIAPRRWRGFYGSFFQCFFVFGVLSAQLAAMYIADGMQWRIMVAVPGVLALAQIVFLPLRVESPSYLIMAHHINEARHALLTLRRGYDVAAEWQDIMAALDTPAEDEHPAECAASCLSSLVGFLSPVRCHEPTANATTTAAAAAAAVLAAGPRRRAACAEPPNEKYDSNATMKELGGGSSSRRQRNHIQLASSKHHTPPPPQQQRVVGEESTLTFADSETGNRIPPQFAKHTASVAQILLGRTREDLRHMVACSIALLAMQPLVGITSILFSGGGGLADAVFASSAYLSTAGSCIVICIPAIPAALLSMAVADRWGRRPLLLLSLALVAVCHALASVGMICAPECMAMAAVFVCFVAFNLGVGPVPWYYATECIPSYALSSTLVVGYALNWALSIAVDMLVLVIPASWHHWLFAAFGACSITAFVFVLLFVPETSARSVAQTVINHQGPLHIVLKKPTI